MAKQSKIPLGDIEYPSHIAVIMDGNGRWAKKRGLPRTMGHRQGAKVFGDLSKYCRELGIPYLTAYAFSTENWKRPKDEVDTLMDIFRDYLKEVDKHAKENVRVVFLGDKSPLAPDIREKMELIETQHLESPELTLSIAINYGGRGEILRAVQQLAEDVRCGTLEPGAITEEAIAQHLDTAGIPDPDIIIRPSGEQRISNFLLWQCAYTEFVFLDVLWPDFTSAHLDEALRQYAARNRRFGGIAT